jgi:hypothetical protein
MLMFAWAASTPGAECSINGELSGWLTYAHDAEDDLTAGLRYVPEASLSQYVTERLELSLDVAVRLDTFAPVDELSELGDNDDLDLYRAWLRLASDRMELRAGLQKINFGSATLFRPLRWFDRMDPRDPLKLTEGVYGLLGRCYFQDNANIWLWTLYGNDEPKGWESIPTCADVPEFGGRLQRPCLGGEMGISYHHRQAELQERGTEMPVHSRSDFNEDRYGFDGRWDVGVGLWLEGSVVHQELDLSPLQYQRMSTVGTDYTFDLGNGLHVLGEHFVFGAAEDAFGSGDSASVSAVSLNYPIGLIDNLSAIAHYDWDNSDWYRFLSWQRRYDNWAIHVTGFLNPEDLQIYHDLEMGDRYTGKGVQVLVVWNH